MSSAGPVANREPEDYYTTPSWCVRRLLEAWTPTAEGTWVEPSAGNGAIIQAVDAWRAGQCLRPLQWTAIEVREEERINLCAIPSVYAVGIANFLTLDASPNPGVSVVIGNPPYRWAFEFITKARQLYPNAEILYLLRVAFKASAERYKFMRAHYPDSFELPDRPSFTGDGGDSADYAWLRWPADWERTHGTSTLLNQTPLAERKLDVGHKVAAVVPQLGLF